MMWKLFYILNLKVGVKIGVAKLSKSGKQVQFKKCICCNNMLELVCFEKNANSYRNTCKQCIREGGDVLLPNKYCGYCNKTLSSHYYARSNKTKDGLTCVCYTCKPKRNNMQRKYRKRQYVIERNRNKKMEIVKQFGNVCNLCNNTFPPECFDFHHIDPNKKDVSISKLISGYSKIKIEEELKKCIMICSNCHRTLHYYNKTKQYEVSPWEL